MTQQFQLVRIGLQLDTNVGLKEVSLAQNGWQKLPSGLVLQWGNVLINQDTSLVVNLPIAFPNLMFCVVVTSDYKLVGPAVNQSAATVQNLTKTNFSIANDNAKANHFWFSIGY